MKTLSTEGERTAAVSAFADQVAVVTGAGSGIGRAVALALAAQSARVCLVGRRLEALEAVAELARTSAPEVLSCQADLSRDQDIREVVARLEHGFGHVDILVHSAGFIRIGGVDSAPVEELDYQYRINVRAPYALTQAVLPMLKRGRGQIVFINSSAGLSAGAGFGQYAATKHGLKAVADSLREEVNPDGVRVLSVFLGRTATPMQAALHAMEGRPYHPERLLQPEDVAAVVVNALSVGWTAEVTEIKIRPLRRF